MSALLQRGRAVGQGCAELQIQFVECPGAQSCPHGGPLGDADEGKPAWSPRAACPLGLPGGLGQEALLAQQARARVVEVLIHRFRRPVKLGLHPGNQFVEPERLAHVVVRAEPQSQDHVSVRVPAGEEHQ
jgi:hypothetical protein